MIAKIKTVKAIAFSMLRIDEKVEYEKNNKRQMIDIWNNEFGDGHYEYHGLQK